MREPDEELEEAVAKAEAEVARLEEALASKEALQAQRARRLVQAAVEEREAAEAHLRAVVTEELELSAEARDLERDVERARRHLLGTLPPSARLVVRVFAFFVFVGGVLGLVQGRLTGSAPAVGAILALPVAWLVLRVAVSMRESGTPRAPRARPVEGTQPLPGAGAGPERAAAAPGPDAGGGGPPAQRDPAGRS